MHDLISVQPLLPPGGAKLPDSCACLALQCNGKSDGLLCSGKGSCLDAEKCTRCPKAGSCTACSSGWFPKPKGYCSPCPQNSEYDGPCLGEPPACGDRFALACQRRLAASAVGCAVLCRLFCVGCPHAFLCIRRLLPWPSLAAACPGGAKCSKCADGYRLSAGKCVQVGRYGAVPMGRQTCWHYNVCQAVAAGHTPPSRQSTARLASRTMR
jgi:hypothetical protein